MIKDFNHLDFYDYHLPEELIANEACSPRENSRLLLLNRKRGVWSHHHVYDLPDILSSEDLVVVNDSKVMKARIRGNRQGGGTGAVEVFLLQKRNKTIWICLMRASAKIQPGFEFVKYADSRHLRGIVLSKVPSEGPALYEIEFSGDPLEYGELPFPPYIRRPQGKTLEEDEFEYQTVFAQKMGSVAAPTAGLHFSGQLLNRLNQRGIDPLKITLHVGLGTFQPIKTDNIEQHKMHVEQYEIPREVAEKLNNARLSEKKSILAVGTTSFRTLQSAFDQKTGEIKSGKGETDLYVYPGMQRQDFVVDKLMTNFHLPKSALLLLVSAFAGRDLVMAAYEDAIKNRYRFFSLGDSMLII